MCPWGEFEWDLDMHKGAPAFEFQDGSFDEATIGKGGLGLIEAVDVEPDFVPGPGRGKRIMYITENTCDQSNNACL